MSIPAFSRAQSTLFDTGAGLDNPDRRSAAYKFGSSSPLPSFSSNFGTAPIPADETRPVITKRVNARLQLAAALIEADNESIAQRAAAAAAAAQKAALADPDTPKPPPPPQVKLASQSAIFAPYRQGNIPLPHHRKRTGSNASRLSRLSRLDGDERRPSIDFLGVTLPTEKKYGSAGPRTHSRADSSIGIGGGHSRTNSLLSLNGPLKPGEVAWAGPGSRPTSAMSMNAKGSQGPEDGDALSDWGVEKFLSREEKDKIESGRRSRANSTAGVVTSFGQDTRPGGGSRPGWALSVRSGPTPEAGVAEGIGKARSEIIVSATSGANGGGDLSLLARIKLYRERQENLPPSQWDGPGPTATKEEVVEHLTSMASPKRDTASLSNAAATAAAAAAHGEAGQRSSIVFPGGSGLSDAGPTGDTPSQKAPSILDRRRPHSRSNSVSSNFMLPSTSQQGDETWREGWAQSSGTEEVLKDVLPSPPIKTGNPLVGRPRRSSAAAGSILNRPRSNFGVMGDSWSDQGEGSEYGDAQSRPSSVGLDAFIPESATAANTGEAGHRFTLASADQLDSAFGPRRNSRILCAGEDGGAFGAAMDEENRAGVGSYSRGHSRRNSLMGDNLFNPREEIAGLAQTHGQQGYESPIVGDRSPHGASTPILGTGPALAEDPFSTLPGLGPSPFPASPGLRVLDLPGQPRPQQRRKSAPMDGLSTKQLQAIARGEATFPEHYGIRSSALDDSAIDSRPASPPASTMGGMGVGMSRGNSSTQGLDSLSMAGEPRSRITSMMNLGGLAMEPDLSSANWGKSRPDLGPRASFMEPGFGAFRSSGAGDESIAASMAAGRDVDERELDASLNAQAGEALSEKYAAEPVGQLFEQLTRAAAGRQEVDDEYISPPTRGPLKPKGLRPPKVLIMPTPLQGTLAAPRARKTDSDAGARGSAIYVPDGFILHDGRGLPPMRQLQVHGATGPRPLFMTPGGDKAHDALVSDFLQSEESRRTLKVPAAMPNGIGRRGASPTTALFRNQLVQHAEEREGWGWEPSSAVADAFKDSAAASETDEVPLARLAAEKEKKKKIGMRARRAAKKAKKARKKARRERREKRAQAERDGKSYKAVGVEELSPDEDLDLSSDTEDDTDSEGSDAESEISMNSDDVKRWLDTQRPAGKLFGKSLLDVVDEKKITRKTKARYYGQVELEEAENAMAGSVLGVPGGANDGASIAPSTAARSFRETPIGVNDTRERMQAVFGADLNWAREMEKRRREEAAEEEERKLKELAEEEFRKAEEERKKRKKEKKLLGGKKRKADKRSRRGYEGGEEETDGQPQTLSISAPIAQQTEEEQLESGQISPIRSRTPVNPPTLNLDFDDEEGEGGSGDANGTNGTKRKKRKGVSEAAAEWFARSSDEEEESDSSSSEDEAERRRQAMQRARMSRSLGGSGEAKLLAAVRAAGEDEEDESSDDDTPLAQLKGRTTRPTTLAGGLSTSAFALSGAGAGVGTGAADESSDEELPLAAIIAKRKAAAKLGALDLDFPAPAGDSESAAGDVTVTLQTAPVVPPLGSSSASPAPSAANGMPRIGVGVRKDEEDDSDEDVPLGLRHPNGLAGLAASTTLPMIKRGSGASSDGEDEDDKPLGAAHPQANIIIQQQALIKQLQAENVQARMSSLNLPWMGGMGMGMGMPMGGIIPASVPPPPMMPGAQSMMGLSTPLGGPDQGFDPRMSTVMGGIPHYSNGLPPSMTLGAIPPSHQQHHQQQQQHSPHGSSPLATPQIPAQAQAQAQPVINLTAPSPIPPLMSPVPPVVPPTAAVVMSPPPMALGLDHKANSIDRWRSQVPPDATGSGSVSKASSAL